VFGISMWEVVLILVVALIVLGPKQLTETARVLGRLYREVQKLASDVRNSVDLDSLTSTDQYPEPPAYQPEPPPPSKEVEGVPPGSGEKSGPDFYADLLESSKEEEQKEESASSQEGSEESAKDKAERGGSTSQPDRDSPDQSQTATLDADGKQRAKAE
jgi:Sec-independent protein translocase protein TatA